MRPHVMIIDVHTSHSKAAIKNTARSLSLYQQGKNIGSARCSSLVHSVLIGISPTVINEKQTYRAEPLCLYYYSANTHPNDPRKAVLTATRRRQTTTTLEDVHSQLLEHVEFSALPVNRGQICPASKQRRVFRRESAANNLHNQLDINVSQASVATLQCDAVMEGVCPDVQFYTKCSVCVVLTANLCSYNLLQWNAT